MSDGVGDNLPEIADPAGYMEGLTFHPEVPLKPGEVPPPLADGEDVPVPPTTVLEAVERMHADPERAIRPGRPRRRDR